MSDRRRAQRFAVASAAQLFVSHDVVVEHAGPERFTVLASMSSPVGEEFSIRLRGPGGAIASVDVRTIDSRPVIDGDLIRYRVNLLVLPSGVEASPEEA